jgi:acetyltransferase
MERTKIYRALSGARGRKGVNLEKLSALVVLFSRLVMHERRIREVEINPLLASSRRFLGLDARIVLQDPSLPDEEIFSFRKKSG